MYGHNLTFEMFCFVPPVFVIFINSALHINSLDVDVEIIDINIITNRAIYLEPYVLGFITVCYPE